jgi:cytochrome c oxidase cbb3-type subunit IV
VISGILTAILLVVFIGIFFWAYAPRRKQRFAEAAALPLVEDEVRRPAGREIAP